MQALTFDTYELALARRDALDVALGYPRGAEDGELGTGRFVPPELATALHHCEPRLTAYGDFALVLDDEAQATLTPEETAALVELTDEDFELAGPGA